MDNLENIIVLPSPPFPPPPQTCGGGKGSLGKCVEYLHNKGLSASQVTLVKHIDLGKAYKGYLCEYV